MVISVRKIVCTVVEDAEDIPDIFLDKVQVINDVRTDKVKNSIVYILSILIRLEVTSFTNEKPYIFFFFFFFKGKLQLAGGLRVDLFHRRSHY